MVKETHQVNFQIKTQAACRESSSASTSSVSMLAQARRSAAQRHGGAGHLDRAGDKADRLAFTFSLDDHLVVQGLRVFDVLRIQYRCCRPNQSCSSQAIMPLIIECAMA